MDLDILCGPEGERYKYNGRSNLNNTHLSCASVATAPRRCKTLIPELTLPKMVCLLSRYGVGARVKKNCEPRRSIVNMESRYHWSRPWGILTIRIGPRIGHREDPSAREAQLGMYFVFTVMRSARSTNMFFVSYAQLLTIYTCSSSSSASRISGLNHEILMT